MDLEFARRRAVIARFAGLFAQVAFANAADVVVRGFELLVGDDQDRRVVALLDLDDGAALFVQQVVGDLARGLHQHLAGVLLHRVLFREAQDRQR